MKGSFLGLFRLFDVGYQLGKYWERRAPSQARWYFIVMSVLLVLTVGTLTMCSPATLALFITIPCRWVQQCFPQNIPLTKIDQLFRGLISVVFVGVGYLVLFSFPLSPLLRLLDRRVLDSRPKLKVFPAQRFFAQRRRASREAYFAGLNAVTGKPIFIPDEHRMEHAQIVGVTGGGKTEGGIVPALIHDIAWGRGAIIIDMKGDRSLLEKVSAAVIAAGRQDDFRFFSLAEPQRSHTYNPLQRGNASEIKDKIISSNIWSEVYYKKTSEIATLQICQALKLLERPVTFAALLEVMRDVKRVELLKKELDERKLKHELGSLLGVLDGKTRDLAGLIADFTAVVASDFGPLLSPAKGEIDLLEAYQKNKIVLFQLNTGLYQETAIRLARMIIQDIKTVSNAVQSYVAPAERHFFPVFIDEFASIAFEAFIELINKARSSRMAIAIAHQSLGDLAQVSEGFQNQIFDNTNLRMVFRQNSAESRDLITKMGGTKEMEKITHQVEHQMGVEVNTGMGSIRRVESFQIDPNIVTELPTGYCVLVQHNKSGSERISYMKCDYLNMKREANFLRERLHEEPTAKVQEIMTSCERAPVFDYLKTRVEYYQ